MRKTKTKVSHNLSLSTIIQGFWRLDKWNMPASELARFMNECIERGITTFDTAEIYAGSQCETLMGEAFRADPSIRSRIELVTKTGIFKQPTADGSFGYYDTSYDRIIQSCRESLKRLNSAVIDLYLIHRSDPCLDVWATSRALLDLKAQGLVREVGVSNFEPFKLIALNQAAAGALVTNQIEWSPVCFEHFDSGMMDLLGVEKIHPMIWSPLAGGRLFTADDPACVKARNKITEIAGRHHVEPAVIVYAWILSHPAGAMPIVGSSKPERLDYAVQALDVKLERYEWYEIYAASGQQKIK